MAKASKDFERKPRADYANDGDWLAALDHPNCTKIGSRCVDMHCLECGYGPYSGQVQCRNGCRPDLWNHV